MAWLRDTSGRTTSCTYQTHLCQPFSPLYDAISPRLHIGYLLIMAVRFIIFTSDETLFLAIWNRFCEGLPARGYPPAVQQLILDKIKHAKGFDPQSFIGHMHLKNSFGYWLRQSKTRRKVHHSQSPYKDLWEGTLASTELLHINQVLQQDVCGDRPTVRPSPTWTITHVPGGNPPAPVPSMVPSVPHIPVPSPPG